MCVCVNEYVRDRLSFVTYHCENDLAYLKVPPLSLSGNGNVTRDGNKKSKNVAAKMCFCCICVSVFLVPMNPKLYKHAKMSA